MSRFRKIRLNFLHFSKREKFVAVTLLLTLGLLATQLVSVNARRETVIGLSVASYLLSAWALREELGGVEWITLLSLPVLYTASVAFFYFLLPVRWLTRLPTVVLYAIGMYALLLTENIYNVAAERSIQLVRAARSIGLLLTLVTVFLFFNTLFALRFPAYINAIVGMIISLPLTLQALWSITLDENEISGLVWIYTLTISFILGEIAFILSFWPIIGSIAALFITALFYTLVGIGQQRLLKRLFSGTVRELVLVVSVVFLLMLFVTRWGR